MSGRMDWNSPAVLKWIEKWPNQPAIVNATQQRENDNLRALDLVGHQVTPVVIGVNSTKDMKLTPDVTWAQPAEVDYREGGFVLSKDHLNASTNPPGIELTYDPHAGTLLEAGDHVLTVYPSDIAKYFAKPRQVTLKVRKAQVAIQLGKPDDVEYVSGGFVLTKAQFKVAGLSEGLKLDYTPALGTKLDAGPYTLTVSLANDPANKNHEASPVQPVTLNVGKAKVIAALAASDSVDYVDGGFVLTEAQFKVTDLPEGLKLGYEPSLGTRLDAGPCVLKVFLTDDPANKNHELIPITPATLTVNKAKVTVTLANPPAVDYVAGGFILTAQQFIPEGLPPGLSLRYTPVLGTPLDAKDYALQVFLTDGTENKNHELESVNAATLTVNKAKLTVTLTAPVVVDYVAGGFALTPAQFIITGLPQGLVPGYLPNQGEKLDGGDHRLAIFLPDNQASANYSLNLVTPIMLTVRPIQCTIKWPPPKSVETTDGVFKLTETELCATTQPTIPANQLKYTPPLGTELEPDGNRPRNHPLRVEVSNPSNYSAQPAEVTIMVKRSKDDKSSTKAKSRKDKAKLDPTVVVFEPTNSNRWIPHGTVRYANKATQSHCAGVTQQVDREILANIANCTQVGRHASLSTGVCFHVHFTNSGGLSFGYDHLGDRNVQGVIYDYATNRSGKTGNKYEWVVSKEKTGAASGTYQPVFKKRS